MTDPKGGAGLGDDVVLQKIDGNVVVVAAPRLIILTQIGKVRKEAVKKILPPPPPRHFRQNSELNLVVKS